MIVLGIYNGHNATATLTKDGAVLGSVSEERFTGVKNQSGFPKNSINWLLASNGIPAKDLDLVVFPYRYGAPVHVSKETKSLNLLIRFFNLVYGSINLIRKFIGIISYYFPGIIKFRMWVYFLLGETVGVYSLGREKEFVANKIGVQAQIVKSFDHHTCHAYGAYYSNPERYEKALILTLDGEGDGLSATVNIAKDGKIKRISESYRSDSIGHIYMYLTEYLGMKKNEHEYKVMGLAPYAKEYSTEKVYKKISDLIVLNPADKLRFKAKFHTDQTPYFLKREMQGQRFDNISAAFQKLVEVRVCEWVKEAIAKTGIKNLCLSGGVFMNVKLNQKIMEMDEVERLFIMPSCGDESSPLGACYFAFMEENEKVKSNGSKKAIEPIKSLYWGPSYTNEQIKQYLDKADLHSSFHIELRENIQREIAELLSHGKVVGLFQGKMEWGARALGNRSILANPSNPDVVMLINEQMKDRDFWMPFAPSILAERSDDYLVNPKHVKAPYMILSFETKQIARTHLKAALHPYDFTCRPQIVEESWNPSYYKIIKEFEKLTGIGAVLNTSFNLHGYPIVMEPKDAVYAFANSGLEYLALGNYLITKGA